MASFILKSPVTEPKGGFSPPFTLLSVQQDTQHGLLGFDELKCAEFILYKINNTGQEQPYFVTRLENVKIVGIIPLMADVKDFRNEQYTHFEYIEMVYQKISWLYIDGNIKHTDSWNERKTA